MKTIKTRLFVMLLGMMIPVLTANCSDKKTVEKADATETTAKTESAFKVSAPPYKRFVVVTIEEANLYKEADENSPYLVRWIESDCESDYCEMLHLWSDQAGKPGFELSTDIMACEGTIYPVLGEEGNFFKVSTLGQWCDIESAYIPKASVGDIEWKPIKADMLESEDNYFKCRVVSDGKYKDIVLTDEYSELDGETLQVGLLTDGAVATPLFYFIDSALDIQQEEDILIQEEENMFFLRYNKSTATVVKEEGYEYYLLDLKKLSTEQIAKIVDTISSKKPEYVSYMYHFPAQGLQSFYFKEK